MRTRTRFRVCKDSEPRMTTEPLQRFWVFGIDDLHDAMVTIDHLSEGRPATSALPPAFTWATAKGEDARMSRFKIFESNDTEESVDALNRFFGEETPSAAFRPPQIEPRYPAATSRAHSWFHFSTTHELAIERKQRRNMSSSTRRRMTDNAGRQREKGEVTACGSTRRHRVDDKGAKVIVSGYHGRGLLIPRSSIDDRADIAHRQAAGDPHRIRHGPRHESSGGNLIHDAMYWPRDSLRKHLASRPALRRGPPGRVHYQLLAAWPGAQLPGRDYR